jgi:hypothetical protein
VITTKEDPVIPTDSDAANGAFRAVIVDLQIPVFTEARQSRPTNALLLKPFDGETLLNRVNELLV